MVSASNLLGSRRWDLPTGEMNTTLVIGLAYIFLAYVVHPATKRAYLRVRSYHAWQRVEKGEKVDVTNYPWWVELFGNYDRKDTARVVALLLLLFALASWTLELSIDILPVPNPAYPQTLAPPVLKLPSNNATTTTWHVLSLTEINPEYQGDQWQNHPNVFETEAKSRYYVEGYKNYVWSKPKDRYIDGDIIVASWSSNNKREAHLVYGENATVRVYGVACSLGGNGNLTLLNRTNKAGDSEEWGTVRECDQGPIYVIGNNSKPSIILTEHKTGDSYVIVEETSSEPSFLYSVWKATGDDSIDAAGDSSDEITHEFHIASTVRLAEAVVTGIVNGVADEGGGGACFGLLRAYNVGNNTEDFSDSYGVGIENALPFGEDPVSHKIPSLKDHEQIITGIEMNTNAMVALAFVMGLSFIGFALTLFLCPKYEMDVHDRDELLRAINLQANGLPDDPSRHSAMRIEVQREDQSRNLTVIISESHSERSGCVRFLLRGGPETTDGPMPATDNAPSGPDGAPLPRQPVHMSLGGVMRWLNKPFPRPRNRAIHPARLAPATVLTASRVPSNAGSRVVSPTHPTTEGSSASAAATPTFFSGPGGVPASLLFCSSSSDVEGRFGYGDDEEEEGVDLEMGMSRGSRDAGPGAFRDRPVHGPLARGSPSPWFASRSAGARSFIEMVRQPLAEAVGGDESGGGDGGATGATGEDPFRVPSDTDSLPVSTGTRPGGPREG